MPGCDDMPGCGIPPIITKEKGKLRSIGFNPKQREERKNNPDSEPADPRIAGEIANILEAVNENRKKVTFRGRPSTFNPGRRGPNLK